MPSFKTIKTISKIKLPKRALNEGSFCSAVIAAAGSSHRCGGEDKLLYKINGQPVIAYTIDAFERCAPIREIIIVTKPELLAEISQLCLDYKFSKVSKVITGGNARAKSVYNGVFAVSGKAKLIAVHDGARPCTDTALIENTVKAAAKYHAAAPGIPVISTIKRSGDKLSHNHGRVILETIDRENLFEIQTPQVFNANIIKAALTDAMNKNITLTDECMAVEHIGMPVHIVDGSRRNIKITGPDDLFFVEMLLGK